eukprot:4418355-Pleurochrysis_carterae.AAC.2
MSVLKVRSSGDVDMRSGWNLRVERGRKERIANGLDPAPAKCRIQFLDTPVLRAHQTRLRARIRPG